MRDHRANHSALHQPLEDPLLQGLVGGWLLVGSVGRRRVAYTMRGYWVLDHRFFRLSVKHPSYRATVHIGYDHVRKSLIAHWLDTLGGRPSATLGLGQRVGSALQFDFEYPAGPSHVTFTFDAKKRPLSLLALDYDEHNVAREIAHFTISSLNRQPSSAVR
jgi:hypothetical protein